MANLRYTGDSDTRTFTARELGFEDSDEQWVWHKNAVTTVPDEVWEALQTKGYKSSFVEVSDEEMTDEQSSDRPIDSTLPSATSGSGTDDGTADDESTDQSDAPQA